MSKKDEDISEELPQLPAETFENPVRRLGRARTSEDLKRLKNLNRYEFERLTNEALNVTKLEMVARMKDPRATVKEIMVFRLIIKAMQDGDVGAFNTIMSYSIGKPADKLEILAPDQMPINVEGVDIDTNVKLDNMSPDSMSNYLNKLKRAKAKIEAELAEEQKRNAIETTLTDEDEQD